MNKNEWFEKFEAELGAILSDEKDKAKEYYEELFADKQEQGVSEEDIISEFGSPEAAAKKILEENAAEGAYAAHDEYGEEQKSAYKPVIAQNDGKKDACDDKCDCKNGHIRGEDRYRLSKFGKAFSAICPFIALILFALDGALLNRWAYSWMFLIAIPLAISIEVTIETRNAKRFAYPVFALLVFLTTGMYFKWWHPMWIIFLTIPLYYIIVANIPAINHDRNGGDIDEDEPQRKSKWWIWIIVAGVITSIVLLGIGTTAIVNSINWFMPERYNFDKIDTTETVEMGETPLTEIKIEADTCAVFIEPTENEDMTVEYVKKGFEKGSVTVGAADGVVNIKAETERTKIFGITVNFGQMSADKFIVVKIPAQITDALDYNLNVITGDVKITGKSGENALDFGKIDVENTTGDVTLNDITATEAKVKLTTGKVSVNNFYADNLNITSTTGKVNVKDTVVAAALTVGATTGDLDIEATCKTANFSVTTGDIDFTLTADDITVKATTGDIGGKVKGEMTEYTVTVKAKTGRSNISDRTGTTDKKLTASVTTGRIDIEFIQ